MRYSKDFKDYELLDMANGEKLERWGDYILIRPDPQIIWKSKKMSNYGKMLMQDILEVVAVEVTGKY